MKSYRYIFFYHDSNYRHFLKVKIFRHFLWQIEIVLNIIYIISCLASPIFVFHISLLFVCIYIFSVCPCWLPGTDIDFYLFAPENAHQPPVKITFTYHLSLSLFLPAHNAFAPGNIPNICKPIFIYSYYISIYS